MAKLTFVESCARCGGDHEVEFRKLGRPVEIGGDVMTHWAPCPTTGEPILMRFVSPSYEFTAAVEP